MTCRRQPTRLSWLLAVLLLAVSGCVEIDVRAVLRQDGGGVLDVNYAVYRSLFMGKFATIEKNELLPLTEDEVRDFVAGIDGAQLLDVTVEDIEPMEVPATAKVGGLRRVRYRMAVDDIEALVFDHVRFAYYLYGDRRYFQFRIEKSPAQVDRNDEVVAKLGRNPFGEQLAAGRNLRLSIELPGKIQGSNAERVDWATAQWTLPIAEIVAGDTPTVVAWAEMPAPQREHWTGMWKPAYYWLTGQGWRDPDTLPASLQALTPVPGS